MRYKLYRGIDSHDGVDTLFLHYVEDGDVALMSFHASEDEHIEMAKEISNYYMRHPFSEVDEQNISNAKLLAEWN